MLENLGNRRVTVCRELTKKHETVFQSTIEGLISYYEENEPKGECVLVIEGKSRIEIEEESKEQWKEMSLEEHMEVYLSKGMNKKEAMKAVAKDLGVSKREIYQKLI